MLAYVATHDVTVALSVSMPSVLCAAHAAPLSRVMQCCLRHMSSGLSLLYTASCVMQCCLRHISSGLRLLYTVNFSVLLYIQIFMFLQK